MQLETASPPVNVLSPGGPFGSPSWRATSLAMLGLCVHATVTASDRDRRWWTTRLGRSRSNLYDMFRAPTRGFIVGFDALVRSEPPRQRLRQEILRHHDNLLPAAPTTVASEHIAEYFDLIGTDRDDVLNDLLRAEATIARCRVSHQWDTMNHNPQVEQVLNGLFDICESPRGGSALAAQKAAELGILVPNLFLATVQERAESKPVGYRVFRSLARFTSLWRLAEEAWALDDRISIDDRLASLLRRLSRNPLLDQYPGAEWSIGIAGDRLATRRGNMFAEQWLRAIARDETLSARSRIDAATARLFAPSRVAGEEHGRRTSTTTDLMRRSECTLVARWGDVLARAQARCDDLDTLREVVQLEAQSEFAAESSLIVTAVSEGTSVLNIPAEVSRQVAGLAASAILAADGRLRRAAIETLVASGAVKAVVTAAPGIHSSLHDPGHREALTFMVGRFREPSEAAYEILRSEVRSRHSSNRLTACWAFGDLFDAERPVDDAIHDEAKLAIIASAEHENYGCRHAAIHGLAVIGFARRDKATLQMVEQDLPADSVLRAACRWGLALSRTEPSR